MKATERRPASYVVPPFGEARVERVWSAIEARRVRKSSRTRVTIALAAAVLIAFVGVRSLSKHAPLVAKPDGLSGWTFETKAAPQSMTLPDGSTLEIAEETRLVVTSADERSLHLQLVRGVATWTSAPSSRSTFIAIGPAHADLIAAFEIEARDARYSVDARNGARVAVERGVVVVRDAHATVATLSAGQAWSSAPIGPAPADSIAIATTSAPAPSSEPKPAVAPRPVPKIVPPSTAPTLDAAALFALGDEARLAGKNAEAAGYFDRIRKEHRDDPRAGLAAHQLGRIRLRSLHDPSGAAAAFADAIALSPDAPFREDAELGRIEALDEAGDVDACRSARSAFVAAHPTSALLPRVAKRCP